MEKFITHILKWTKGSKAVDGRYVFGANKKNQALILVPGDHILTMDMHKEMLEEVKALGLEKPMHIWGLVNAGPNGSKSYEFHSLEDFVTFRTEKGKQRAPEKPCVVINPTENTLRIQG